MNVTQFRELQFSLLGRKSQLRGEFVFYGETYINCEVDGQITMGDEGKLILERDYVIVGDIFCQDVEIFGQFSGTINAEGTLVARSSAKISGTIKAKQISIYPGAEVNFEGHTEAENQI